MRLLSNSHRPKKFLRNGARWKGHFQQIQKDGKLYTHAMHRKESQRLFYLKDLSRASQRVALKLSK